MGGMEEKEKEGKECWEGGRFLQQKPRSSQCCSVFSQLYIAHLAPWRPGFGQLLCERPASACTPGALEKVPGMGCKSPALTTIHLNYDPSGTGQVHPEISDFSTVWFKGQAYFDTSGCEHVDSVIRRFSMDHKATQSNNRVRVMRETTQTTQ